MKHALPLLAADLARVADVPVSELPELIGRAEALRAALWARLTAGSAPAPTPAPPAEREPDVLLRPTEAARRLGMSRRWIYAHSDELPFTRRLPGGALRFDARGLARWKANR